MGLNKLRTPMVYFMENTRLDTWNKISYIRKTTQDVENKRNMENSVKQTERMEMLRKIEESYDIDFSEVEKKAIQLMNIEEADELQNVCRFYIF